jgi:formylglycine-generating enzyme required for sulfatase activity
MGSTNGDPDAYDQEIPQHTVYLDAFWIDKHEITNAQYRRCVDGGACREPGCWDDGDLNSPVQPVVCVSWDDARDYATWVGGRLPTEAEWEKAARGENGQLYPWGNSSPSCDKANHRDCVGKPLPVGTHPNGASPYGALDMAGNVAEWTQSLYWAYPYQAGDGRENLETDDSRVVRGGSWELLPGSARCAFRRPSSPRANYNHVGFRVLVAPGTSGP